MRANGFLSPVIFLTAHHRLTDRLSGFSAGGDDYLPKPFHLAELAARLRAALKRAAPPPAAAGDLALDAVRDAVRVEVIDDGPGVPRPFASRLFEPGQRADPGDGHHGAGLGLPLARRLARSAGGEVTYDPEHTPGARFVVSLPAG
ncbi:hybrid sensor histidine kinase/response regulator [Streptomyces mirabilis]|uniref:hybrid sensor histidine kinase/response regulator n=1 Tax=Streptomyces mirabilis TaxID=68239 RepID=UPI002E27E14F|nr:ATP-binding protein [Streptomyces mirabilis]